MRRRSRPRIRASRSYRPRSTPRPTATPVRGDIPGQAAQPARRGPVGEAAAAGRTVRRHRPRAMAEAPQAQPVIPMVRRQGFPDLEEPDRRANPGGRSRSLRTMQRRVARGPRQRPPIPEALCPDLRRRGPAAAHHPDQATPSATGPVRVRRARDHRAQGRRDRARRARSRPDSFPERQPLPPRVPHPVRRAGSVG